MRTEKQIAKIIEKAARDALFNGSGKIINPEIFLEAARKILEGSDGPMRVNSVIPCHKGHECNWPACAMDCYGRPGRAALSASGWD